MFFFMKLVISGTTIAFASWLAGKKPILAGFIVALPLVSMLSLLFAYLEHRDMAKLVDFTMSILIAIPLSLMFFIPFLLNRWIKLGFGLSFVIGIFLLCLAYILHTSFLKSG